MSTHRTKALATIVAVGWSLAACSGSGTAPAGPAVETAQMREQTAAELARLLNDFDPVAFGALLTDDVRVLVPNSPAIEGRDASVEHYKAVVASQLRYEATPLKAVTVGNAAVSEGTYRVKNLANGNYVEDGKFLAVWVNQGGQWKVARFMVNTDYQMARVSVSVEEATTPETDSQKP